MILPTYLLVALLAVIVLDVLTTYRIISRGGRELNPFMKFILDKVGYIGAGLFKTVVIGLLGLLVFVLDPLALLPYVWIVTGLTGAVVLWNFNEIRKQNKR